MSEPRKNSRNKKKDVQLMISCLSPKVSVTDGHSTSVYEIDIQSAFDFGKNGAKECRGKTQEEFTKNSSNTEEQKDENHKKDVHNPFFDAYYPNIIENFSDDQQSTPPQNEGNKVQADSYGEDNKEKETNDFLEKSNKGRQSTPPESQGKVRKHIKNYIIENFIADKNSEMKAMVQNYQGCLDGNEVHLHHHEHHHHHHHYYNGKALGGETNPPPPLFKENFGTSPEIFFAAVRKTPNEEVVEKRDFEREMSYHSFTVRPPDVAEEHVDTSKNAESLPVPNRVESPPPPPSAALPEKQCRLSENEGSLVVVNKASSKHVPNSFTSLRSKMTSGPDLVYIKNSDCSDESPVAESFEIQGIKMEKNKGNKSYGSLMENFKNFSHFMSPIVITDQKTVPKILYIRCECTPWKDLAPPPEIDDYSANDSAEGTEDPDALADFVEDSKRAEEGIGSNFISIRSQRNGVDSSDEFEFEVWTSKLKAELSEIKKELKRIEEKQLLDNRSTAVPHRYTFQRQSKKQSF